jgi:UDP-2-acetamido-2,6-beta-L-arabino-hexul-4-ose reductase
MTSSPLRIGITGAGGFLGWHMHTHLLARKDIAVDTADRQIFADPSRLRAFVASVDAIAHFAGSNRGSDREIHEGNVLPVRQLVEAMQAEGVRPHVLFANSIQHSRNTAYALSKRAAAGLLAGWSLDSGAPYANVILPHLFGEAGRPFYNSAVTTFCHQIANGEEPRVIVDADLELVHAQRVAARMLAAIEGRETGDLRVRGTRMRVSDALARIRAIATQYEAHVIPPLTSEFELDLFNTYRSYLFPRHYPRTLQLRSDARGELFEAVRSLHGGQCFLSTTRPGITRGNHYHHHKLERFLVVSGEALIRVRRLLTSDVVEYRVTGDRPAYVDMPALHTHNITNTGKGDLLTMFWSHEIFDPETPDTFQEAV